MTAKHTPGPWTLSDDNQVRRIIKGGGDKPRTVCIIEDWTTEPDALLIAAAPEQQAKIDALANALEQAAKYLRGGAPVEMALDAIDAALRAAGRLP